MARPKSAFVCLDCGAHSVKWQGQCPDCGAWNTLRETRLSNVATTAGPEPAPLGAVGEERGVRHATGFEEFDRVLGGGLVPGAVILLGGDPGVGKSTLLQQVAAQLPEGLAPLYASGEESLRQISERAERLGVKASVLRLLSDTSLENILAQAAASNTGALVVDSIQTTASADIASAPGSVSQLREVVGRIVQFAKQRETAVFLIGHVTKEGAIAGPRVVEHMVDTVLYFESDPASRYTIVRAAKNRFGASSEMGVFAMTEAGFREVVNPSAIFLARNHSGRPGSVVMVTWEGSRPLLVEIQALVADASSNYPRRLAQGIEQNRLALLTAVLQRHAGLPLAGEDIFVNVVGGLRIGETASDLPTLLAVVSSFRDRPVRERQLCFGEIGLSGEVRPVRYGSERLAEAAKQGFTRAIIPSANVPRRPLGDMEIIAADTLDQALAEAFDDA